MKRKNAWLPVLCCVLAGLSMLLAGCKTDEDSGGGGGAPPPSFKLTIIPPENGTITTNPDAGSVRQGTRVTVTATEDYGYEFKAIKVNGDEISGNTFTMPSKDTNVTAEFTADPASFAITTEAVDAANVPISKNFTITITGKGNVNRAFKDDVINVTAGELNGFDFDSLTVQDSDGQDVAFAEGKFTMPESDVTITAVYTQKIGFYTVYIETNEEHGAITTEPTGSAQKDDLVTIAVTPKPNYEIVKVSVLSYPDGTDSSSDVNLTAETDNTENTWKWKFEMPDHPVTVTATFKPKTPELYTVSSESLTNGSIVFTGVDSESKAKAGDPITVKAIPVADYVIDGSPSSTPAATFTPVSGTTDQWIFPMPASAISVRISFRQKDAPPTPTYLVSSAALTNGSIAFIGVDSESKAKAGDSITVTASPDANYEVDGDPTSNVDTVTFESAGDDKWSFTMPASAITVTVNFKAKTVGPQPPTKYLVTKGAETNGTFTITGVDGENKAEATATITVTASPNGGYEVDGLPTSNVPLVTFTSAGTNTWTFPMPASAITVNVAFKAGTYTLTVPESDANGTFSFDKSGTVAPGTTVTLTVTAFDIGYKMSPTVTPSTLALTKTPGKLEWTFAMPTADVTFTKIFAPLSKLEIYKGGARAGITLDNNAADFNEGGTAWIAAFNNIVLNADEPGRDGNVRVLKVPHNSNLTFALVSDTPFNIASDNIVALSFWAKGTGNVARIFAVGFGDLVNGDNRQDVVTYHGESRENFDIPTDGTWKHYIVPVPAPRDLGFTRSFYIRADLWGNADTVYLDDIEFLTSGVSVDEIKIPAGYYTNGDNTATGEIAYPGPNKVTPMLRNKIRGWGDKATTTYVRYKHDDGTTATLFDEWASRPVRFDRWYLPAFTYTVDGDATIADAGTFDEGGLPWKEALITTTKRNGTVNLYANLGGKASTPMVIQIADSITLEDFEMYDGGIPDSGNNGYWHQNMGMTWFATGGDEKHDGAKGGLFSPTQTGAKGGRNFPAPVNLNNCTTITFWMRTAQPADSYTLQLANGGTFTGNGNGTFVSVPFTITAAANEWQQVTLNLSAFTTLDKTAVTGWALGVTTHTTGTEYRLYIDTIEAK